MNPESYTWIAVIFGLTITCLSGAALLAFHITLKAIYKSYAVGESSGFRKSQEWPPLHIDGEPTASPQGVDMGAIIGEGGDMDDGLQDIEPDGVRVNLSGGPRVSGK